MLSFHRGCKSASTPTHCQRKLIVFEENLLQLFLACRQCQSTCRISTRVFGSALFMVCTEHHKLSWASQSMFSRKALGNAQLSATMCFSEASTKKKVMQLLQQAGICVPSNRSYYLYQLFTLQPAIT